MIERAHSAIGKSLSGRAKAPLLWAALVSIVLLFYVALEVAYRAYLYFAFRSAMTETVLAQTASHQSERWVLDLDVGWRYAPNLDVSADTPYPMRWRTNSHGHVSEREYPVEKPADEFRIAILGDSFTANINNTARWVDLLDDRLNANPDWSAIVGRPRTVVINFARDGIGLEQMAMIAVHEVEAYAPDLSSFGFRTSMAL